MRTTIGGVLATAVPLAAGAASQAAAQTTDRLYDLDCGHIAAPDQSRWSTGVNVGKPIELSNNCFLLKHGAQWLLWDTGHPDSVADKPVATPVGTATRARKLVAQLAEIGVVPQDIGFVALSHTHGDHVGNVDLFPAATLLIQKAELEWAFAPGRKPPFKRERPMRLLTGDLDLFGDASAVILSTPGHTPGHQALLVHLARTGWVVLSGDLVHFKDNWDNKRVPGINTDAGQSLASMKRIEALLAEKKGEPWINHDEASFQARRHAPQFYD